MHDFLPDDQGPAASGVRAAWRARGLKRTKARELVHELLRDALSERRHLDAETLYQRALFADEPIALATVYRVLADFEHLGLVQVHAFRGMRKVYELEAGQPQDHLVNVDTGEISHLPPRRVDTCCATLAKEHGVEVVRRSVTLYVRNTVTDGDPVEET